MKDEEVRVGFLVQVIILHVSYRVVVDEVVERERVDFGSCFGNSKQRNFIH